MKIFYYEYILICFEEKDIKVLGSFETFASNVDNYTRQYHEINKEWISCCQIDYAQKHIYIHTGRADLIKVLKGVIGLEIEEVEQRINKKMKVRFKHVWGFRDHIQKGFVEEFLNSEYKNHYGVLPCGAGKTYGALKIAEELGVTTLIIVDEITLLDQWKDDIINLCGYPEESFGEIHGKKKNYEGKDLIIATKQTIASDENIAKYLSENMSFVVIDECHTAPTEVYTSVITKLKPRYKLGLTATPIRQDGNQYMLENYIGSRHFIATQEDLYAVGSTIKPNVVAYLVLGKTPIMEDHWNERLIKKVKKPIFWRGAINQWIARKSIHKKIASLICTAYKKNRSIAVILKEKKIITMYYDLLIEMGVDKDEIVIMIGDTEKDYRKEIIDDMKTFKKKIILTSKLLDKAISINRLDTVFNVYPTKDEANTEQRIGRICRTHKDKNEPLFVDFVYDHVVFYEQFCTKKFNRMNVYKKVAKTDYVNNFIKLVNPYFNSRSIEEKEIERKKLNNTSNFSILKI